MSTEIMLLVRKTQNPREPETSFQFPTSASRTNTSSSGGATGAVEKVWCAPMSEAGEWVITWTQVPGALSYELQTSLDGGQWSSGSRFSGTRAVLLLGPIPRYWVRVRAIGRSAPGAWSEPKLGQKGERFKTAA